MSPRRWFDQAWPDLADLAGTTEVGLVPVGAVEQHGPHLPTGTDTIIATGLCERVSERTGAPVLPAISVGCSYGHSTNLPGNLSLTPEQLAAQARQWAEWAATSGLTRLLFVNAHFGNAPSLLVATDHLRLYRTDLRVGVVNWWTLDPTVAAESTADGDDLHANRAETAVMLWGKKPPIGADDDAGLSKWRAHVRAYRGCADAALEAIAKKDVAAGKLAIQQLSKKCNECHKDHRKEE